MTDLKQSSAILLRKIPWSETSLIVSWLTEEYGFLRTLAKGARQPRSQFAGKLDLLFRADIAFTESPKSDLHTLREVQVTKPFSPQAGGGGALFLGAYFGELAGLAAPSLQPAPEIYDLLLRGIDHLNDTAPSLRALEHFERELARILGVHDPSGKVSSMQAIASLYGRALPSREAALRFLR